MASAPLSPPARRARRKQARPSELLDAALDLFVDQGYAATRVEQVAARAGVSKGTLFLYYASKEALFRAVVHENLAARLVEWNAEYESFEGSTAQMLQYCLDSWWTRVGATRASGITRLVLAEAHNFPAIAAYYQQAVVRPAHDLLLRIVRRGIDSGEFRRIDPEAAVHAICAAILYMVTLKHTAALVVPQPAGLMPERHIAAQLDLLLAGLQGQRGEAPL